MALKNDYISHFPFGMLLIILVLGTMAELNQVFPITGNFSKKEGDYSSRVSGLALINNGLLMWTEHDSLEASWIYSSSWYFFFTCP